MSVLTIAANAVRRLVRDRAALFFVFAFPLLLVLLLGSAFGGEVRYELAIAGPTDGPYSGALLTALQDTDRVDIVVVADADAARTRVARGRAQGALLLPPDLDRALAAGEPSQVTYVAGAEATAQFLRAPVLAAVDRVSAPLTAGLVAADLTGTDRARAIEVATTLAGAIAGPQVRVTTVGGSGDQVLAEYEDDGAFALVTHQELLLFTFLTSLTAASALIQNRRLGVTRRMLATRTTVGRILLGEALGRFAVAMVQVLWIVVGTAVLFGVGWGSPAGWVPLVTLFALVSAGAGMLMGAAFRNDEQAAGLGVFFGLALAAIGGCMLPLELFSPTLKMVAHLTPHAWALDGFRDLVAPGGGLGDIASELAVLAAYAAALLTAATAALRWRLLQPS